MYPKAVYLDTNILKRLRPKIDAPEFQEFKNICDALKISIFIPQVVLDEWIYHFIEDRAKKDIQQINSAFKKIKSYIVTKKDISIKISSAKVLKDLKNSLKNRVEEAGIAIIQRPKIRIETLIKRAVNKVRPFTEGGKGFRDTIILYTILAHARQLNQKGEYLFITDDGDFDDKDITKTASNFNVKLIIFNSIEKCKEHIYKFLEDAYQTHLKHRASKATRFLSEKEDKISAYINKHGKFSDMFFFDEFKKAPFFKSLKRINNIKTDKIHNAKIGFLPENKEKGWVEISFSAKSVFHITVEISPTHTLPKLSVGEDRDMEIFLSSMFITKQKELIDETLTKDISVNVEALIDRDDKFYDFKIKNIVTY